MKLIFWLEIFPVASKPNLVVVCFAGEVVYDSIIQNKHKTKSYWEQLMMAAAASEQPRTPFKRDLLSLGSDGEDGNQAVTCLNKSTTTRGRRSPYIHLQNH